MKRPLVLAIGGHDPSGGAGIQADIEAIGANGGQALTLVTALTVQDGERAYRFEEVSPDLVLEQGRRLLERFAVAVIKIGMVGTTAMGETLERLLIDYSQIPVVLDPVLQAGGGGRLAAPELVTALRQRLLPRTTLTTPNRQELIPLGGVEPLLESGCQAVLVTGTDRPYPGESSDRVYHQLTPQRGAAFTFEQPRLPHHYHGSGCTLASAIATRLALGEPIPSAVSEGLDYTLQTLRHATRPTAGQHFPHRLL